MRFSQNRVNWRKRTLGTPPTKQTLLNIRRAGRQQAVQQLSKVTGLWAQRRRRSAPAAIVTARFLLAGVTEWKHDKKNQPYEILAESREFQ